MIFHHHFFSIKSLFQFVIEQVNYLKFLTDWIYYVHVMYYTHVYQLLTNILMIGNQCPVLSHQFNIRVNSYFTLLFINQQAPK